TPVPTRRSSDLGDPGSGHAQSVVHPGVFLRRGRRQPAGSGVGDGARVSAGDAHSVPDRRRRGALLPLRHPAAGRRRNRLLPLLIVAEIMSLGEAISADVSDGDVVALEGFTHLIPFAAGHEIIRQGRRDLTLIRMTPDLIYDQMIGMGCARKLIFSWGGNPGVG